MSGSTETTKQEANSLEAAVGNMSLGSGEQSPTEEDNALPLEPLFKLCMKYYRDNVAKGMAVPYKEKTYLLALHKQITCGKYTPDSGQEPGYLDVVGNDRKQAWQALGDMAKEDAMKEFVRVLHKVSPSVKPHVIAYKIQLEEEEKQKKLEEEQKKKEEEEAARQREAAASQSAQEQQVRQVLNQQTEAQFKSYAQTQFPDDPARQENLMKQLQEQHFQQYVRQVYETQMQQQQSAPGPQAVAPNTQQSQQQPSQSAQSVNPGYGGAGGASQQIASNSSVPGLPAGTELSTASRPGLSGATHNEQINGVAPDAPGHTDITLQEASMWTQKDITVFKNAIKKESKMENHTDCIIKVGSGETVTIRVPTHENGNCLFWEFATDHYDIAFGVYFEWNNSPEDGIHLHVSDSSDDEEEESANSDDKEKGGEDVKKPRGPPIDEIIPIYRRDSHEEVYCGSHVYPGRGVYLLKFDNSYSLWRSKTLYYRVFYSR